MDLSLRKLKWPERRVVIPETSGFKPRPWDHARVAQLVEQRLHTAEVRRFESCHVHVIDNVDLAWAAGLLEGEGTFGLQRGTYPRVSCSMTDEDVLQRLQDVLGGQLVAVGRKQEHWKAAWVWAMSGDEAARMLGLIRPYMGKRRGARIDELIAGNEIRMQAKRRVAEAARNAALEYGQGHATYRMVCSKHGVSPGRLTTELRALGMIA